MTLLAFAGAQLAQLPLSYLSDSQQDALIASQLSAARGPPLRCVGRRTPEMGSSHCLLDPTRQPGRLLTPNSIALQAIIHQRRTVVTCARASSSSVPPSEEMSYHLHTMVDLARDARVAQAIRMRSKAIHRSWHHSAAALLLRQRFSSFPSDDRS